MARHLLRASAPIPAAQVAAWADTKAPKKDKGISRATMARANGKVVAMLGSGDWSEATPIHLVALYAWCHMKVYGVEPGELHASKEYSLACIMAGRMLQREFSDSIDAAVAFMRWLWKRETEREKWRRTNNRDGQRIGWRLQFAGSSLVTDYRVDLARRKT